MPREELDTERDKLAYAEVALSQTSSGAARAEIRWGSSVLEISGTSVVAILNAINDAFAFYRDLEQRLTAAALSDCPEQAALSACEELIGPTAIFATNFKVLAASQKYIDDPFNAFWDTYVIGNGSGDFSLLDNWEQWPSTTEKVSMKTFVDADAASHQYGLFNSYLDSSGNIIGYVITGNPREYGPFDFDVVSVLMDALALIQESKQGKEGNGPLWLSDDYLARQLLLYGNKSVVGVLRKRHATEGKKFAVFVTHVPGGQYDGVFRMEVAALIKSCLCLAQGDSLTILAWGSEGDFEQAENEIARYLRHVGSRLGMSNYFEDASMANRYVPQAFFAYAQEGSDVIRHFFDQALSYLAHCDNEKFRLAARHPAVERLVEASSSSDVDYSATLRAYLMCDRSVNRAAESLYLRRNTVVYRINQARKLAEFDLDDDYERHYLLFSLLV